MLFLFSVYLPGQVVVLDTVRITSSNILSPTFSGSDKYAWIESGNNGSRFILSLRGGVLDTVSISSNCKPGIRLYMSENYILWNSNTVGCGTHIWNDGNITVNQFGEFDVLESDNGRLIVDDATNPGNIKILDLEAQTITPIIIQDGTHLY